MDAELLIHDKVKDSHGGIIEVKIWMVTDRFLQRLERGD